MSHNHFSVELIAASRLLIDKPRPSDAEYRAIAANSLVSIATSLESLAEYERQKLL